MEKDKIRIVSSSRNELSSAVIAGGNEHHVHTENNWPKSMTITTQICLKGKILDTVKSDCRELLNVPNVQDKIYELMQSQHEAVISMLKKGRVEKKQTARQYLDRAKMLMSKKHDSEAYELIKEGLKNHQGNPFLLSYAGYLEAVLHRNYKAGIELCKGSIFALEEKAPFGADFLKPSLYLNLGRVYVSAGRRKNAVDAFAKGLEFDSSNSEILSELRKIGFRRKSPLPFLRRSNPLNKYLGKLLYSKAR